MTRVNKNLVQFTILLLILSSVFFLIFQKFTPFLSHLTYYCQSFLNNQVIAIPQYISLLPFAMLFAIFIFSVGKALILYFKVILLKRKLQGEKVTDTATEELILSLGLSNKVNIIQAHDKFAFCLGLKYPKIYVSTQLINALSSDELSAVLKHEEYHLKNHDSFTMLVASIAHSLFPFFPIIGDLINKYRIDREIEADAFAIKSTGASHALISALKKLLIYPTQKNIAYAAIADEDTLEPRIYSLLNRDYIRKQFRMKNIFVTIVSFILVTIIVTVPVYAKELHHDHYDVMLLSSEKSSINSCTSFATN